MIPLAGKKSKTAKEALIKYLRSFYKRHRGMAALALLLLLGQVVGTLLIPALIANVVDLGILPGNMDAILRTGGQMLAVALLSAAPTWAPALALKCAPCSCARARSSPSISSMRWAFHL